MTGSLLSEKTLDTFLPTPCPHEANFVKAKDLHKGTYPLVSQAAVYSCIATQYSILRAVWEDYKPDENEEVRIALLGLCESSEFPAVLDPTDKACRRLFALALSTAGLAARNFKK